MAGKGRRIVGKFKSSSADIEDIKQVPDTPQTRASAYKLAFADEAFLVSEYTRNIRLQLEYLKPELTLIEKGINSTIVLFGGARIPEPGQVAETAKTEIARKNLEENSKYYQAARDFAALASTASLRHGGREYVVVTGGGPGVMEAGNRGAHDVGADSIGLNIVLEHEQAPNAYITPDLCFNFHYFAIRKMHFLVRARAVAVFPGGFGTMDELFETLTLIQTGRMERIPVLLFGTAFWQRVVNLHALAEEGTISPEDVDLFQMVDSAEDGWNIVADFYNEKA